jgi:hypothetical protein
MTEGMAKNSIYPVMDFAIQFPEYTPKGLYNDELEQINNIQDFNLLMITKKDEVFEKDKHRLVVDTNGNCYWWPEWLRLANSSGIINSIASNYSRDYTSANDLYRVLAKSTISYLDKLKNYGNEEIKLVTLFNNLRELLTEKHYEELTPSRFQVISSPDWAFRMIISDDPRMDLQEIVIPKQSVTTDVHPYPTEWLIQSFADMDISSDIVGPGDKVPRLLDVFQSGDYERTLDSINGEQRVVTAMLKQIGIPPTTVDNIPNKRRPKILLRSLGFELKRGKYYQFFTKESLEKKRQPKEMFEILEMRSIEVYNAWINSFKEVLGIKSNDAYFQLLNEDVSSPFNPSTLSLGSVLKFMQNHRGQIKKKSKYSEILSKTIPNRFLLVSKEVEEMLEILTVQRNLVSHSPSSMKKEQIDRIVNLSKQLKWNDPRNKWSTHEVMTKIAEFFEKFYGVDDENNIPIVPTLMKITAIEEGSIGHKAVMTCQRNGVVNKISLNKKNEIQYYSLNGKLIENTRPRPLSIGMRMYILPTTNPIIVAPIVSPS